MKLIKKLYSILDSEILNQIVTVSLMVIIAIAIFKNNYPEAIFAWLLMYGVKWERYVKQANPRFPGTGEKQG